LKDDLSQGQIVGIRKKLAVFLIKEFTNMSGKIKNKKENSIYIFAAKAERIEKR
jgi:hypothetical protein